MSDVSSIASLATGMARTQLAADVQTSVQRMAMDIQQDMADSLIDALPDTAASIPGETVGSLLDVRV